MNFRTVLFYIPLLLAGLLPPTYGQPKVPSVIQDYFTRADKVQASGDLKGASSILDSALVRARKISEETSGAVLMKKAFLHQVQSEFGEALKRLHEAQNLYTRAGIPSGVAEVLTYIGAIHQTLGDYPRASECYQRSLDLYTRLGLKHEIARCYNNFGSLAEDMHNPERALAYHRKSSFLWNAIHEPNWVGISFMHMGTCHDLLGHPDSAIYYLEKSAKRLKGPRNERTFALICNLLGNAYRNAHRYREARAWCEQGLLLSRDLNVVRYEAGACECLYRIHESLGEIGPAFAYHKRFVRLRDSVFGEQKANEVTRIEMTNGFRQQQLADSLRNVRIRHRQEMNFQQHLAREKETRNLSIFAGILFLGLAGGLWNRLHYVRKSRKLLSDEKDKSEHLLLNILPAEIVEELKRSGKSEGREHEEVSVLFLDVRNFTAVAQQMGPRTVVSELNACFEAFDAIVKRHGLEKIKTIGDSYMAAAGVPQLKPGGAACTIHVALEIQEFLKARHSERMTAGEPAFEMRAGIHSGPVVAGVVGSDKFQYDIWGDTVNTASRMETAGEAGRVNISGSTYHRVKDESGFRFEYRGAIEVKGKGLMEMYFVEWGEQSSNPVG